MATNYGGTWHELSLAGLPNRYITSIAVDPKDAAHVYASIGSYSRCWIPDAGVGHLFESRDGCASWTDATGNPPDAPVYKVIMASHHLVVGTEVGSFIAPERSTNRRHGTIWTRLGSQLPKVTVWDLTLALDNRTVVAGTHGRGDWQIRLSR